MKNPSPELLAHAFELHQAGTPVKAILAETGLGYSQMWLHVRRCEIVAAGLDVEPTSDSVVDLRQAGHSWGEIAVRCGIPESRVRKLFSETTGTRSEGLRIGKGGRHFYDEAGAPLYQENLKATGTAIPVGTLYDGAIMEAGFQRLLALEVNELKAMAEEAGVKFAKTTTKAVLVKRLRDAAKAEA